MRHWLKTLALLPLLAFAAPAEAAILPGATVDGPSNLIESTARPDVDVAPDGSTALVYLKSDGGRPPVRLPLGERGLGLAATSGPGFDRHELASPVAVANGGKVVVTYIRGLAGDAVARISPSPGAPFGAEHIIQAGGSKADVDLSPTGTATPSPSHRTTFSPRDSLATRGPMSDWAPSTPTRRTKPAEATVTCESRRQLTERAARWPGERLWWRIRMRTSSFAA